MKKEFLEFEYNEDDRVYYVDSKKGERLGEIHYFKEWHTYVLEPYSCTYFDKKCLKQILEFMEGLR